jgi:hypothetical protein
MACGSVARVGGPSGEWRMQLQELKWGLKQRGVGDTERVLNVWQRNSTWQREWPNWRMANTTKWHGNLKRRDVGNAERVAKKWHVGGPSGEQ